MSTLCGQAEKENILTVKVKRGAPLFRRRLDRLTYNIYPCIAPDYELLDDAHETSINRDIDRLARFVDMSEAVHSFRTAQAFNAAALVDEQGLFSRTEWYF